jgi:hypothetical protein
VSVVIGKDARIALNIRVYGKVGDERAHSNLQEGQIVFVDAEVTREGDRERLFRCADYNGGEWWVPERALNPTIPNKDINSGA